MLKTQEAARVGEDDASGGDIFERLVEAAEFAFQPITDVLTGQLYGVEALLRGYEEFGFTSPHQVFDQAYALGQVHRLDVALRGRAMKKFKALSASPFTRLFVNMDNRAVEAEDYRPGDTLALAERAGIAADAICLEISERHQMRRADQAVFKMTSTYQNQSFRVAIDDFGSGFAGLRMLYEQNPDFIKIDRFFISDIDTDRMKKLFVSEIIKMAQTIGITVIAEGVETENELLTCKELGSNLMQGYFIQRPTLVASEILPRYTNVVHRQEHRGQPSDRRFIDHELERFPAMPVATPMPDVFEWFRCNKDQTFFPVVNDVGEPIGIIREEELKDFTYSRFGKALLSNASFRKNLNSFVTPCPVVDIRDDAERILEKFTLSEGSAGVIVVENLRYQGFLTADSLLRVMNEKNLAHARDSNPLSKLPGNNRITEYVVGSMVKKTDPVYLVYLDFDNFKPFNDTYGFRQGDRAILLFAELMQKTLTRGTVFLGHVGGDDFFAGIEGVEEAEALKMVSKLREEFGAQVGTFYDKAARDAGGIVAKDREGQTRKFPLLCVSCAVLVMEPNHEEGDMDVLVGTIAGLKKEAKAAESGLAIGRFT